MPGLRHPERRADPVRGRNRGRASSCRGRSSGATPSRSAATRRPPALSGVNIGAWKTAVYIARAGCSPASRGVLIGARVNSAQPALGLGYELDAIAAVVIGGTSLSGGEGIDPRHDHRRVHHQHAHQRPADLSVPQEWQTVVTGVVVILAVYLDIVRRRSET